ncbi:hypothetical protein SAMN02949497_2041 [Methylomagnum ishizawai]|uniref:Type VI lipoprotein IgE-like C-terminal domain-containing protein n=1 Tax=Methylomagnum ishizawai TaxID=1760988 RepID=A0A1Y6CVN0_9GAMM|nr:hypothetical protein [Methylomagnum ishizawai]SMF94709.1 hypothetical protein SAMN02949497_2041 [Methylomagnum ishizawai]
MPVPSRRSPALPLLIAACLGACASGPEPPPPMEFDFKTEPQANDGRLFYFMARAVNEKQFMMESYQDVAAKAFADPPDPSVLGVFSVIPGSKQEFTVTQPAQGTVALYFLLTRPGQQWKRLLSPPLDDDYDISIAADNLVKVEED